MYCTMFQTKNSIVHKTNKYRLKTNSRIVRYVESLEAENRMWIELGIMARNLGVSFTASSSDVQYPRSILTCITVAKAMMTQWDATREYPPLSLICGAILAGIEMKDCKHLKDGKNYPIFFLGKPKRARDNVVVFSKSDMPFYITHGRLPEDIISYKIVDITNHADRCRQFELHVTTQKQIPNRKITGVHAVAGARTVS